MMCRASVEFPEVSSCLFLHQGQLVWSEIDPDTTRLLGEYRQVKYTGAHAAYKVMNIMWECGWWTRLDLILKFFEIIPPPKDFYSQHMTHAL